MNCVILISTLVMYTLFEHDNIMITLLFIYKVYIKICMFLVTLLPLLRLRFYVRLGGKHVARNLVTGQYHTN